MSKKCAAATVYIMRSGSDIHTGVGFQARRGRLAKSPTACLRSTGPLAPGLAKKNDLIFLATTAAAWHAWPGY